jgi:ABC-2 type transport system permease protein
MFNGELRSFFRFTGALLAMSLRSSMALRGAFLLQASFMAINNVIFFVFWWLLLHRVDQIRGWRISEMAVLFGVVAAGYGLAVTVAGGVRHLVRFVTDGVLDAWLTLPKPPLAYALLCRSQASGLGDLASGLLLLWLSGAVKLATIPVVAGAVVASAVVLVASGVAVASLSFWLGKMEGAARQAFEAIVTFSLYPEPLFGGLLRVVLFTLVPAGFVGYLPAEVVRNPSLRGVAMLVAASASYAVFAVWLFGRGLRSYASGSRFGVLG